MKLQTRFLVVFSSFLLLIFAVACSEKETIAFEKTYELPKSEWAYADSLNFEFDIADTTKLYDIVLDIRHTTDFPFQNLYTNIALKFPKGERSQQVVNIDLADNTGKWHGEGTGDTRLYAVNIQTSAFFNQMGKHRYTLQQFMRTDILRGVKSISLKLAEKPEKRK
jgi:gliding motility-associated lipoprotein GldH